MEPKRCEICGVAYAQLRALMPWRGGRKYRSVCVPCWEKAEEQMS